MLYESSREFASVYERFPFVRSKSDQVGWVQILALLQERYWRLAVRIRGGSWFGHLQEGVRGGKTHGDYLLEFRANWRGRRMGRCSRGFGDACLSYFGTVPSCKESVDGQIISVTF